MNGRRTVAIVSVAVLVGTACASTARMRLQGDVLMLGGQRVEPPTAAVDPSSTGTLEGWEDAVVSFATGASTVIVEPDLRTTHAAMSRALYAAGRAGAKQVLVRAPGLHVVFSLPAADGCPHCLDWYQPETGADDAQPAATESDSGTIVSPNFHAIAVSYGVVEGITLLSALPVIGHRSASPPAPDEARAAVRPALNLTVMLQTDGALTLDGVDGVIAGPNGEPPTIPPLSKGQSDMVTLRRMLSQLKRDFPDERRIAVAADWAVKARDVAWLARACAKTFDGLGLFPEVWLVAEPPVLPVGGPFLNLEVAE